MTGKKDYHRKGYHRDWYQKNKDKIKTPDFLKKKAEYNSKWRKEHPEQNKKTQKDYMIRKKIEAMTHYCNGVPHCQCPKCNESNIKFLSIDHINNDGAKHRKEINKKCGTGRSIYVWLKQNNYPPEFQVLCYNCNLGKAHNKCKCPHLD